MAEPTLPTAPSIGGRRPALIEPRPWNRDERILWAFRRGVERASGRHITADQAWRLLVSISAPDAAFGFAAGIPGGAIDAARDYTVSLLDLLRGVMRFYSVVYDPAILLPTFKVWTTLPGSPERSQLLEEIAERLLTDHPEVAEAIRWIPVLELAMREFLDWLRTNEALLELSSDLGEGIAELIGKEIGVLLAMNTPFEQGEHIGRATGYVATTVLLEILAF
jgi:hypothetical protein